MFGSILFIKLFNPIFVIVIVCSATLYGFSVPMIKKTVYATEEASTRTILNNVYKLGMYKIQLLPPIGIWFGNPINDRGSTLPSSSSISAFSEINRKI